MPVIPPESVVVPLPVSPRYMDLQAFRLANPGSLYPSLVERWGVQRDDGAGPLSRLVSLCAAGVSGYTVVFDADTRALLDALPRPERMRVASALIDSMFAPVPAALNHGNMALRYGVGHLWHVHGLLDTRALPHLSVPSGWDVVFTPLATLDDVKRFAGYCVKHARRTRGRTQSWELDATADRLLRDRRECREQGLTCTKLVRWFGLPSRAVWMTNRRHEKVQRTLAARRAPRPSPPVRAPLPETTILPLQATLPHQDAGGHPTG